MTNFRRASAIALHMLVGYSLAGLVLNLPEESLPLKTIDGRKGKSLKAAIKSSSCGSRTLSSVVGFLAGAPRGH